jgi:hypothetical protein
MYSEIAWAALWKRAAKANRLKRNSMVEQAANNLGAVVEALARAEAAEAETERMEDERDEAISENDALRKDLACAELQRKMDLKTVKRMLEKLDAAEAETERLREALEHTEASAGKGGAMITETYEFEILNPSLVVIMPPSKERPAWALAWSKYAEFSIASRLLTEEEVKHGVKTESGND